MKLMLFTPELFSTILLPKKCAGQYWITARDTSGKSMKIMAVEGIRSAEAEGEGEWILKSNSRYRIIDGDGKVVSKAPVRLRMLYTIQSTDGSRTFRLYIDPLTEDRSRFTAYKILSENVTLNIGRLADCDIQYASNRISKRHATLQIVNDNYRIMDNGSLNGTYVNGCAVEQAQLKNGDTVVLMGLQIVVAGSFLYLNNPDGLISVHSPYLKEYHRPLYVPKQSDYDDEEDPDDNDDFYYRAPRFKHDVDMMELRLDAPPAPQTKDSMPLLMTLGPSVTMGMASATTASYAVYNAITSGNIASAIPSMAMGIGMLGGTLLWPIITKTYQKKELERKEGARQKAYTEYLAQMEERVCEEIRNQEQILRDNDQDTQSYLNRISSLPLQIWERTPKHTDFLKLRLGVGNLPLNAEVQYPERRFSVEQDSLTEAMYQFGEKERWLSDVPICLPLAERFVSGIYSGNDQLITYAKSLILQLVMLHSYDEVKLVLLYDERHEEELSFARWLPHTMDNDRRVRYIATNYEEAKELSADLEQVIEHRTLLNADQLEDEAPYYVVLCLDRKLASRAEFLRTVLDHKENIKFSVLAMYERLKDLPKECSAVVELDRIGGGNLTLLNDVSDPPIPFRTDCPQELDMQRVTEVLANTQMNLSDTKFQLPKKYTFLEMLGVGMVEHINLLENWSVNDPTHSLAAPIGIDRFGELFMLDLHEKAHGPHGLIAGMTGSGKSETIIAYILSMAVNYHPNEVAFILIDYKGGGMAKAFENIPHTAGIITNLDGSAINRSLVSMQSELHRRERIFQLVSKQHNISNIDIYKYQKLYREGKVSEPLPHLIIVSDEFAELKKDQPDFMAALTSTARVGRSLGVHLILATQKPGGVVDDQIRSNSRFRLCLKVQDKGDSTEMMGRPEASLLSDTGRFYLQVGNNELFELGQSAWAGAAYHPSSKVIRDLDDAVTVINTNGRVLMEVNSNRFANHKNARKQLDILTDYIRQISEEEQIPTWKMWLDPIPGKIYVDELEEKYPVATRKPFVLEPVVGEYDDPAHQSQNILRIPLSREGNVVVYGSAGSGKGIFLEAMCYSLLKHHSPDEVNLYIMDFGSETMTCFAGAPHVGDVVLSHETEKVENLFKLLQGKIHTRKKLLSAVGGSLDQYNAQAAKKEPNIVVVINNFANFTELFDSKLGDLNYLTREGIKYGIYFVLSCTGVNNVRFSMLQNFKNLYCLQMNNPGDYANVVGKTGGLLIEKSKGRGMVAMDKGGVLEFQSALVTRDENPYAFYREFCKELSVKYSGTSAAGVPVLPEVVSVDFLKRYAAAGNISSVPVGVQKETLDVAYQDFSAQPVHLVLSVNQEWKNFTESLAVLLSGTMDVDTILIAPSGAGTVNSAGKLRVCSDRDACVDAVHGIFKQALTRNNSYKSALEAGAPAPEFQPLFVIVQSMAQLKNLLSTYTTAKAEASDDTPLNRLQVAMEKCAKEYNIFFVVAENIQSLTPFTAEKWYKAQVSGNSGIWIGSGINSQYRLNVSTKPQGYNATLTGSFGFQVNNTLATLVKFLQ